MSRVIVPRAAFTPHLFRYEELDRGISVFCIPGVHPNKIDIGDILVGAVKLAEARGGLLVIVGCPAWRGISRAVLLSINLKPVAVSRNADHYWTGEQ